MASAVPSPFLDPGPTASPGSLALLSLRRDLHTPLILQSADSEEQQVVNTRFGTYPHSTLVGLPWGTQVLASKEDSGRSRRSGKKRKREENDTGARDIAEEEGVEGPVAASSGFAHLVPPTPESWTMSLPHRTQVVYTPDYSYILQRLRVRPGDIVIEAGSGSGSFTHAAARAVFSGHPDPSLTSADNSSPPAKKKCKFGKVYSYEYHLPRAEKLREEIKAHGLDPIVTITHRDVYQDGFSLHTRATAAGKQPPEPLANAVFLDLPAPWLALKHLTRERLSPQTLSAIDPSAPSPSPIPLSETDPRPATSTPAPSYFPTPLDPSTPIRLCTFSPCIEQVQKTASTLRQLGWVEIDMVEVAHKRLEVRRERIGLAEDEQGRGAKAGPASVAEAVGRLKEQEGKGKAWREMMREGGGEAAGDAEGADRAGKEEKGGKGGGKGQGKQGQQSDGKEEKRPWRTGRLVHRTEPEIKTHTSYLLFAILPRLWTRDDEERCRRRWGKVAVEEPAVDEVEDAPPIVDDEAGKKRKAEGDVDGSAKRQKIDGDE
ncbi:tRNA (adenine-N(1)-)-methyltransferase catalytic subunit trm61 [Coniosporium apollinis]|uniref:tRNA (adenine(58)-N(1))-methyltransferase catalytic subunit TRM61 n=1 Tax=Coniosporium apollinis TaxID=61459 RepID=A0ABQ9NM57_9PEZI|nr:tRNA (adenine-N(1)-)-methyltransferase catalytic subunit trm61 [Coniosporium apollinis]